MTIRVVLAMTWSAISGLAGGWLVLSPWALGQQPSGRSWTTVTNAQVRTGLGLLALAVVGLLLAIVEGISGLRAAGVLGRRNHPGVQDQRTAPVSEDLDRAMIALANALASDLNDDRRPGVPERARSIDAPREDSR